LETSGWEITNLSATNGLFVNGNKIIKHMLKNEDLIELGASSFKYNSDDSGEDDAGDRKIPDWMRNQD
jgi:pSer/pThr/pTyr-binding forkhead associated (FHA) protein